MMKLKKIMFIVMCVLLALVVIATAVLVGRVGRMLGALTGSNQPTETTTEPQTESTAQTTVPPTTVPPTTVPPTTVPPTTVPTEPEHAHNWELTESVEANCENYGYKIYTCTECGKQDIPYDEQVAPYGHNFGAGERVSPTCTEEGYTAYVCTTCNKVEKRNVKPATGHEFVLKETVEADCLNGGYEIYACSACALEEKRNETEPLGHSHQLVGDATQASCTEDGTALYRCSHCGDEIQESTPAYGHAYSVADTKDASCTEDGYILYHCDRCGDDTTEQLPATGHSFSDWVQSADGGIERSCEYCELVQTGEDLKIINAHGTSDGGIIMVYVGLDAKETMFHFTIYDGLCNGTLAYHLEPDTGLVVIYTNANGVEETIREGFLEDGEIRIPEAGSEQPATQPSEPETEATEPSAEATEPSAEATEPPTESSTEPTQPSAEATEPTAAHEHTWSAATCTVAATCTECGETDGEPTGHLHTTEERVEPNCTLEGYVRVTCADCGAKVSYEYLEPVGECSYTKKMSLDVAANEAYDKGLPYYVGSTNWEDFDVYVCSVCGDLDLDTATCRYTPYEATLIMMEKINELRISVGVDPLEIDSRLVEEAIAVTEKYANTGKVLLTSGSIPYDGGTCIRNHFERSVESYYDMLTNEDYKYFGYSIYNDPLNTTYSGYGLYGTLIFWDGKSIR